MTLSGDRQKASHNNRLQRRACRQIRDAIRRPIKCVNLEPGFEAGPIGPHTPEGIRVNQGIPDMGVVILIHTLLLVTSWKYPELQGLL